MSALLDKHFDGAYNISLSAQDIPHVRFGRVDYLTVTELTTKWVVWKYAPLSLLSPYPYSYNESNSTECQHSFSSKIVERPSGFSSQAKFAVLAPKRSIVSCSLKDGRTFLRGQARGPQVAQSTTRISYVLSSSKPDFLRPCSAHILDKYAVLSRQIYNVLVRMPKWLLLLLCSGAASLGLRILHSTSTPPPKPTGPVKGSSDAMAADAISSLKPEVVKAASLSPSKSPAKKRKGNKKA